MPKRARHRSEAKRRAKRSRLYAEDAAEGALILSRPPPVREVGLFQNYYDALGLFTASEWLSFLTHCRRRLPVTVRFIRGLHDESTVAECLQKGEALLYPPEPVMENNRRIDSPVYLEWCDSWQLGADRELLKFGQNPYFAALKEWMLKWGTLPTQTSGLGVLTRQEVASMVPAALLAVQPHHRVLDMCAAPGSKTIQLLEGLHGYNPETQPTGVVVANDVDVKRCYGLAQRCRSIGPASQHLYVVTHKAQMFPNVTVGACAEDDATVSARYPDGCYDRIICDVPCCGDGTVRKFPNIWHDWSPGFGLSIHSLQIQIAMRGLALLSVGGLMTYSTCSFNPIENEAVVAELLRRCGSSIEIVDASTLLPDLDRRPGITHWKVLDDDLREWARFEDTQHDKSNAHRFRPSMWPQDVPCEALTRCLRLYPHLSDTGGFFVALIRKRRPLAGPPAHPTNKDSRGKPLSWKARKSSKQDKSAEAAVGIPRSPPPTPPNHVLRPVPRDHLADFVRHVRLRSAGLELLAPRLYSRSANFKTVICLSEGVVAHCLGQPGGDRLNTVWTGLPLLQKDRHSDCGYLIQPAGVHLLLPYMRKQVVSLPAATWRHLLRFSRPDRPVAVAGLVLARGACVLTLEAEDASQSAVLTVPGRADVADDGSVAVALSVTSSTAKLLLAKVGRPAEEVGA